MVIIRAALAQNPKWKGEFTRFFTQLKDQPGLKGLIDEKRFDEKDWIGAVDLMAQLNRDAETTNLAQKALQQFPHSSYLHYLLGKSLLAEGKKEEAKAELRLAVTLDGANDEAVDLLRESFK